MFKDPELIDMYGRMLVALEILEACDEFAPLVPEVRTNMVFARQHAKGPEDVMAIDGRITVMAAGVRAAGRPRLGASSHMARLMIQLMAVDPTIRAGVDFRADTEFLTGWLEEYAEQRGWVFSSIDRSKEPEELHEEECASMPWKVAEVIRAAGGKPPKLFYETGAVGKEPVAALVGADPIEVVEQVCEIARLIARSR